MSIDVVPPSEAWLAQFRAVSEALSTALRDVPIRSIEHVGSTSVPELPAKPILDIDVIVEREHVPAAIHALEAVGYIHRGDLGAIDREAFHAPDEHPRRHVYVCVADTLHVRNHLAMRDVLRTNPELRDRYGAVKLELAREPNLDIQGYLAGKSAILQEVLALSDLSDDEKDAIRRLNTGA